VSLNFKPNFLELISQKRVAIAPAYCPVKAFTVAPEADGGSEHTAGSGA
jgi:hypothetical protein